MFKILTLDMMKSTFKKCLLPLLQLSVTEGIVFCVCAVLLVVGIGLFNMGADIAMTPMGMQVAL